MMGETHALELRESFGDSPLQTGKNELVSVPVKGTSVIINCVASPEEQPVVRRQAVIMQQIAGVFNPDAPLDRKSTRLNSSHVKISYAVFCLKKKKTQ